jgi:hypothetical protein
MGVIPCLMRIGYIDFSCRRIDFGLHNYLAVTCIRRELFPESAPVLRPLNSLEIPQCVLAETKPFATESPSVYPSPMPQYKATDRRVVAGCRFGE